MKQVGGGKEGQEHTMALGCYITNEEFTQGGIGSGSGRSLGLELGQVDGRKGLDTEAVGCW